MGSASRPLMLTYLENRLPITENGVHLFYYLGKGPAFEEQHVRWLMLRAIAEQVLFRRMPMKVKVELKPPLEFLFQFDCQLVQIEHLGIDQLV